MRSCSVTVLASPINLALGHPHALEVAIVAVRLEAEAGQLGGKKTCGDVQASRRRVAALELVRCQKRQIVAQLRRRDALSASRGVRKLDVARFGIAGRDGARGRPRPDQGDQRQRGDERDQ